MILGGMGKGKKMKDILLKRNKLKENSIRLRTVKFDESVNRDLTFKLNREQDEIYKKYKFYDNFIKANEKERMR